MPAVGTVLEIASGTGEHAVFLARRFPQLLWQPSDADGDALASIAEWAAEAACRNLLPPIMLDASAQHWPVHRADAVLCINMVHISPWRAAEGLFAGAAALLAPGGGLILYGPYREQGVAITASNEAFDASLKARNPEWGLRELGAVDALAIERGFARTARYPMPANNLMLVYRRLAPGH